MSMSYLIQAVRDEQVLARGTAWFLDARTVVTAFHVVGDEHSGEWLSAKLPALEYRLTAGAESILLMPLAADESADVALLTPAHTPVEVQTVRLAAAGVSASGAAWNSAGFPAFHDGVFHLSGTMMRGDDTRPERAWQLTVAQGTDVDWSGMSGAPVWSEERVVGLITQMAREAATGWATSAAAIRRLHERIGHAPGVRQQATRQDMLRSILQQLQRDDCPGVALLEPLRFDARSLVDQVIKSLQEPARRMLLVRLVPNPQTTEARHLYGALYRDVRRGLRQALGQRWSTAWQACFDQVNDPHGRAVEETEFQCVLEDLLDGPIREAQQHLVLIVEGLSTVSREHVQSWGWLMQRLAGPLKLLIWGGADLHQLCTAPAVGPNSVFHRLTRVPVESFLPAEVDRLLRDHLGIVHGAEDVYRVTHGHPALVREALEVAGAAARMPPLDDLSARLLTGVYLHHLKLLIDQEPALQATLQRLHHGDAARRADPAEERLCWLGLIREHRLGHWGWTAPILTEWSRQWYA